MTYKFKNTFWIATALFSLSASPALAGDTLVIENFIGTLKVNTLENGPLEVIQAKNDRSVEIKTGKHKMTIDGGVNNPDGDDCESYYGRYNVSFFSKKEKRGQFGGYKDLEDYPVLTVNAPTNLKLVIRNSIPFATFGDIGALDAVLEKCGRVSIGDLSGNARISIKGSADVSLGNLQDLSLVIKGSGDVETGNARNIKVDLTGSGDVSHENVQSADLRSKGSGDFKIDRVQGPLRYISRGSGDFEADEINGDLVYEGKGSGDFYADTVVGDVSIKTHGSGDVTLDGGQVGWLLVTASGSGDVDFDGTAEDADLSASGSSSISVDRVTGRVDRKETGSADIVISDR